MVLAVAVVVAGRATEVGAGHDDDLVLETEVAGEVLGVAHRVEHVLERGDVAGVVVAVGVEAARAEVGRNGDAGAVSRDGDLDLAPESARTILGEELVEALELVRTRAGLEQSAHRVVDLRQTLTGDERLVALELSLLDELEGSRAEVGRVLIVEVRPLGERQRVEHVDVGSPRLRRDAGRLGEATEGEEGHGQRRVVRAGQVGAHRGEAFGEAPRPCVPRALVVAVGLHVDAVDDEEILVVLLEEGRDDARAEPTLGVVRVGELHREADVARLTDHGLLVPVHWVRVVWPVRTLGVAEGRGVPATTGVEEKEEGSGVRLGVHAPAAVAQVPTTEGGGGHHGHASTGGELQKITTIHCYCSFSFPVWAYSWRNRKSDSM